MNIQRFKEGEWYRLYISTVFFPSLTGILIILITLLSVLEDLSVEWQLVIYTVLYAICLFISLIFYIEPTPRDLKKLSIVILRRNWLVSKLANFQNLLLKVFSILTVIFFSIFVYHLLRIYIQLQDDILKIKEVNQQVIPEAPKATILAGIPDALTISFVSLIVVALGTISTLILGWRSEKRNKLETQLRIEKLELEIVELKSKQQPEQILIYTESKPKSSNKSNLILKDRQS